MNVFDLAARLMLDKGDYDKGLDEAESKGGKFGKGIKAGAAVAGAAIAATAAAAVKLGKDFVQATGEVAEYGDHIDKMSQQMGISAEAYQEWDAIMQHSGTTIDALKPAMKTLANQAQQGAEEFTKLGISEEEVKNLSQEDLFSKVIAGLQGMEEGTERTAVASKLLGRGATELGALLNTSAEETENMRQTVHDLGGVMSDEAVKAAATYQDTLQNMQTAITGLKNNLLSEFLPGITGVMDGLTQIFSGDTDSGVAKITEGITSITDNITEMLPTILEVGGEIVLGLATAIVDNLPELAKSAVDVVMKLADGIIDNLPTIMKTGMDVLMTITKGISENLPTLMPAMEDAIWTMAETLTEPDNLETMIETGFELMGAIVKGIVKSIPRLLEGIGKVFVNIGTALGEEAAKIYLKIENWINEKLDKFKTWGKDLIDNFINGIKEKFKNIKEAFTELGNIIKNLIGFSEPKEGPLSNFHTFAPDMIDLFIDGITANRDRLQESVASAFDFSDAMTAPQYSRGNVPHGRYQRGGGAAGGTGGVEHDYTYEGTAGDDILELLKSQFIEDRLLTQWYSHMSAGIYQIRSLLSDDILPQLKGANHIDQDSGTGGVEHDYTYEGTAGDNILELLKSQFIEDRLLTQWYSHMSGGIYQIRHSLAPGGTDTPGRTLWDIQESTEKKISDISTEIKNLKDLFTTGKAKAGVSITNAREVGLINA